MKNALKAGIPKRLRPEAISILKVAYDLIKCESEDFVCHAISAASNYPQDSTGAQALDHLETVILESLGDSFTVSTWLHDEHDIPERDLYVHGRMREYRKAWIKMMIKQLR